MDSKNIRKILLVILCLVSLTGCKDATERADENEIENPMTGMPCHQMGGVYMGDCEFDENGKMIEIKNENQGDTFNQETENLPLAQPSEIVELKDGDHYLMTASLVQQEIGNQVIKRLAYNSQIPGPLLSIPQGAHISLELKNELDVETTLHSHGLRLNNAFDGVPEITQEAIKPGESFTYELTFPDEGVYWYHPHVREDYTQELGLYGNFLVEAKDENYWNPVDKEVPLILDDLLVSESEPNFYKDEVTKTLMGRFGNIFLINNEENYQLEVKKNEVIRLYLTNVANTRTFNIQIPGVKMKLVGGDLGRIEKEAWVDSITIAPAERYIVEIAFDEEGDYHIENKTPANSNVLGSIQVKGEVNEKLTGNFNELRDNSQDFESIRSEIKKWVDKTPDQSLRLSIDMMGMGGMSGMEGGMMGHNNHEISAIEWEDEMPMMNNASNSENTIWKIIDENTGKENMDIDWRFKEGDWVKVRIFNDPNSMHPMQHPIHFHGQRFLVLSRNGEVNSNFQWKDTTLIKNGETVDLLVEMSNPGKWMAHCHIAEHLHSGMMFGFEVK